jgi:hypothetical protein
MAVQLPDGRVAGIVQSMCEPLQLDRTAQLRRIRRNESLARHLLLVPVLTNGGIQKMDVLVASAIPRWLDGIQVSRLAPAKRPLARALQRELEDALNHHFFGEATGEALPPQPETPKAAPDSPAQMIADAVQTIGEAVQQIAGAVQIIGGAAQKLDTERQTINEHLTALEQWRETTQERQQVLGEYLVETRERVKALEQRRDEAPYDPKEDDRPVGKRLLSPQHLGQVYVLARQERQRSGEAISALLAALAQAFGVPDISDLPESAWDEVLGWFWERQRRR